MRPGNRPFPYSSSLFIPMTLADAQAQVDAWIRTTGVRYFDPLTNLGILMEETGEVARLMVRLYGEQSFKPGEEPDGDDAGRSLLGDELADVLWVVLALANQTGVDLTAALYRNLEKKTARDAARHRDNKKLQ